MSFVRYLLNISYMGYPFRGSQRQIKGGFPRPPDPNTIQGRLEMGLKLLNPQNEPIVLMASRTDKGVHALNTTCHVDLCRDANSVCEPISVTCCLNKYFRKNEVPIRIIKTHIVPQDFHARKDVKTRTYLYRLMIYKSKEPVPFTLNFFPIEELHRCHFFCTFDFDLNVMRKAADLFEGYHDFRTFMAQSHQLRNDPRYKLTRKEITKINIVERKCRGYSPCYSIPECSGRSNEDFYNLDIYITGKGFLYKQVRRTAATLVSAAQGKVTLDDIKWMIQVPSRDSWLSKIQTLPAHGLYLCKVEY